MTEAPSHGRIVHPSDYRPAWWLPEGHSQTLWGALGRRPPPPPHRRERLELPDGDFLDLVHVGPEMAPLVLVLHGLEGGFDSPHIRLLLATLARRGWHGVLMHFRGCSGVPNRLPRNYHSGETTDLDRVLSTLRARQPRAPASAVGYSLGGNVLLKYLGEQGRQVPLRGAVAISVPFDLACAARRLNRGFSRLYQRRLIRSLQRNARRKSRSVPCPIDLSALAQWNDFHTWDERLTAPLHGFAGAADYYRRSSSRGYLGRIEIPTLLLQALDDPFLSPDGLPAAHELAPQVTLELARCGGHVGFVTDPLPGLARDWLERRIADFLAGVLTDDQSCTGEG